MVLELKISEFNAMYISGGPLKSKHKFIKAYCFFRIILNTNTCQIDKLLCELAGFDMSKQTRPVMLPP
jgi:hypothetical protein